MSGRRPYKRVVDTFGTNMVPIAVLPIELAPNTDNTQRKTDITRVVRLRKAVAFLTQAVKVG